MSHRSIISVVLTIFYAASSLQVEQAARARTFRNTTVVLNGEPKSGTTWLEFVAKELLTEACELSKQCDLIKHERTVSAQTSTELITYDLDEKHTIPHVGHINKFDFTRAPDLSDAEVRAAAAKSLAEADDGKKWLVIFRDPRDVTISSCYHMFKGCPNANGYVSSKISSITAWINLRHRFFKAMQEMEPERVMLLFYEEMKQDEKATIQQLADYFGVKIQKPQAQLISERTTFSAMKEMPKKAVPSGGAASGKVREGATCGYKKELSSSAADRITKYMRDVLGAELNAKWAC